MDEGYVENKIVRPESKDDEHYWSVSDDDSNLVMYVSIWLNHERLYHRRSVYTLLDVLGDYGGVQSIVFLVVPYIVSSFAEHSFVVRALQLLFLFRAKSFAVR